MSTNADGTDPPSPSIDLNIPLGMGLKPRELIELARIADDARLGSVAVGELDGTEAFALLAAMAVATNRIGLSTGVVATTTRSPALLAMSAATLNDLSEGRFVLGLGAGSDVVAAFHGRTLARPREQVRDQVEQIRTLLAGGRIEANGSFRLRGVDVGAIPILLSAGNPRMLALAGEIADGMIINFSDDVVAANKIATASAEQSEERTFETHVQMFVFGDDEEAAREQLRLAIAPAVATSAYRRSVVALAGPEAIDEVTTAWRRGGRQAAAAVLPDSIINAVLVGGTAEAIAVKVADMGRAGCSAVRFAPIISDPGSLEANARTIELLGTAAQLLRRPADAQP